MLYAFVTLSFNLTFFKAWRVIGYIFTNYAILLAGAFLYGLMKWVQPMKDIETGKIILIHACYVCLHMSMLESQYLKDQKCGV